VSCACASRIPAFISADISDLPQEHNFHNLLFAPATSRQPKDGHIALWLGPVVLPPTRSRRTPHAHSEDDSAQLTIGPEPNAFALFFLPSFVPTALCVVAPAYFAPHGRVLRGYEKFLQMPKAGTMCLDIFVSPRANHRAISLIRDENICIIKMSLVLWRNWDAKQRGKTLNRSGCQTHREGDRA
jgi:hypothetical protein